MKRKIDPMVGLRIRNKRKSFGYSRECMADKADMSPTFLADIEYGNKSCSFPTLIKICRTLGVSSDYILFGNENIGDYRKLDELLSGIDEIYFPEIEAIINAYVKSIILTENRIGKNKSIEN